MYRRFLNARSPLRLLEKGLDGGLGRGNLGLVLSAPGVGKTSFLVDVALDELLRGEPVLHISLDHPVSHVRAYYDTLFDDLASATQLEDLASVHADVDRIRHIRAYAPGSFDAKRLREAVSVESSVGARPRMILVDGFEIGRFQRDEVAQWRTVALDADAELWVTATAADEQIPELPPTLRAVEDLFSVILALEPGEDVVALRALKDHENPDIEDLRVVLDPKTLLLARS